MWKHDAHPGIPDGPVKQTTIKPATPFAAIARRRLVVQPHALPDGRLGNMDAEVIAQTTLYPLPCQVALFLETRLQKPRRRRRQFLGRRIPWMPRWLDGILLHSLQKTLPGAPRHVIPLREI